MIIDNEGIERNRAIGILHRVMGAKNNKTNPHEPEWKNCNDKASTHQK